MLEIIPYQSNKLFKHTYNKDFKVDKCKLNVPSYSKPEFKVDKYTLNVPSYSKPEFKVDKCTLNVPSYSKPKFKVDKCTLNVPSYSKPKTSVQERIITLWVQLFNLIKHVYTIIQLFVINQWNKTLQHSYD